MKVNITKEYLFEQYVSLRRTIHQIALDNRCSDEIVRRKLDVYGIPRRKSGTVATGKWINRDWLEHEYRILGKTMRQIAEENHCGETVIKKWIDRHGIEPFTRSERLLGIQKTKEHKENMRISKEKLDQSGKNNPNWRGGITSVSKRLRQSKEFKTWRDAVVTRDNNTCVVCGSNNSVHAHHIIPFYRYPEHRYNVSNGITLCIDCHRKAHNGNVTF